MLFAPRISQTDVAPSSKHDPVFAMSVQSKSSVKRMGYVGSWQGSGNWRATSLWVRS